MNTTEITTSNETSAFNQNNSIYFIEPQTDPELIDCHGIELKTELQHLFLWKYWITGVVSAIVIVLGCIGNLTAILLLQKPKMSTAFNQLLIVLCIFDTVFLISNIPTTELALQSRFLKIISPYTDICGHISVCSSVFMIVALTFERHFAICSPHAYRIRLRTTKRWKHLFWYVVPVITLAAICNIPLIVNLLKTDLKKNALYVKINLYLRGLHPLATTGLIPLLLLVILNIKVVRGINILTRKRTRKKYPEVDATSLTTEDLVKLNQGSTKKNIRHAKEIRASYLAFGIVCTFLLLNLPRIVASSIEVYHSNLILHCIKNEVRYVPSMNYYKLDFFARFFMVVNSAINFLIYCAVSSSFQETFFDTVPWMRRIKPALVNLFQMQEQVIIIPNNLGVQSPQIHSGPPPPLNSDEINEDDDEDPEVDDDKLDHHGGVEMFEISPPLNGTLKIDITLTPNIAGCSHQNPMFLEKEKTAFVQTADNKITLAGNSRSGSLV